MKYLAIRRVLKLLSRASWISCDDLRYSACVSKRAARWLSVLSEESLLSLLGRGNPMLRELKMQSAAVMCQRSRNGSIEPRRVRGGFQKALFLSSSWW